MERDETDDYSQEDNLDYSEEKNDGTFEGYPPKEEKQQSKVTQSRPKIKKEPTVIKKHVAESKIEEIKQHEKEEKEAKKEAVKEKLETKKTRKEKPSKEKKTKKESKKDKEEQETNEKGYLLIIFLIGIIGLLAIVGIYKTGIFSNKGLAAKVYTDRITLDELDKAYDALPENIQIYVAKTEVLDQLITKKLLLNTAKQSNVNVNDSEVEAEITLLLMQSGVNENEFQQILDSRNVTYDEFKVQVKEALIINKLAKEVIFKNLEISDAEVKNYYEENPQEFIIEEEVNASHILICYNGTLFCEQDRTRDDAYLLAVDVKNMVNSTNFGELAALYSDEPGAPLTQGNLGFFGKNRMVPEFETAAFSLQTGEVSPKPVETDYGYHLIKVFDRTEPRTKPLAEVNSDIKQMLESQKQQLLFEEYVKTIRADSEAKGAVKVYYKG